MRPIDLCPYRKAVPHAGPGAAARCELVRELVAESAPPESTTGRGRAAPRPKPGGRCRIGFVSPCGYLGGAERWHATLIPRLDRERFEVTGLGVVNTDQTHPILMDELAGICRVVVGPDAVRDLAARVDLLVVWGVDDPGRFLPVGDARPLVVMVVHNDGRDWAANGQARRAARDVDHWACVGATARDGVPDWERAGAVVIPNGVDPARVRPTRPRDAVRAGWGLGPGRLVLGFLGRISPEKNPEALVEAVACLHRQGRTEWAGVLVGDGFNDDYVSGVKAFAAQEQEGAGAVVFAGGRTDVGDCLAGFDALLVPSHGEGFCLTMVEGWMAGVPVLATRVGLAADHPELVRPLETPCRGADVARALAIDRSDPAGTAARVALARGRAATAFSADLFARRWSDYLAGLADRPAGATRPSRQGVTAAEVSCEVGAAACGACCAMPEPSPTAINHVIASRLFSIGLDLTRRGDDRHGGTLQARALPHLRRFAPALAGALAPPRTDRDVSCFHRGARARRGDEGIQVYECLHLLHRETTDAHCRTCPDYDAALGRGAVRRWAVGVTTAPRDEPTLSRCLSSLASAGWTSPRVFAEPGAEVPAGAFPGLTVTRRDGPVGEWPNWYLGLAELVQRHPIADAYMMVQDDTVFSRNVRGYLEASLWPAGRVGLVSVYCPTPYARDSRGWNRIAGEHGLIGALTYIFPNAAARAFLAHPTVVGHRRSGRHRGLVDTDAIAGRWAWQAGLPVYYLSPSLAQHVGETSTVWPGAANAGSRRSSNFAGAGFDAMRLLDPDDPDDGGPT